MIENRVVSGGPELDVSTTLSYGKYVLDKLKSLSANGHKIAMINVSTQEQTSYEQLLKKVVYIANGLKKMNIGKGDVIAICSENCTEYIAVVVAAVCIGATVSGLGLKYTKDEVLDALSICQPKMILCSESAIEKHLNLLRGVSCIQHVVQLNGTVKEPQVLSLDELMVDKENVEDFQPESVDSMKDIAFAIYGTGNTGGTKCAMLTHYNVVYGSEIFSYANAEPSVVLTIPPWYHLYGLLTTIQFIISGNMLIYMLKFDPEQYLASVEKYQVTKILAVSKIITLLAKSPLVKKYDLSSVRVVWCSTIPITPIKSIINAKKNLPNCKGIFQAYGLTESSIAVLKESENYDEKNIKEGSCGTPLPGIMAKIVDINTGEKLEAYQNGEICLKGPTMMKGFLGNENATRETFDQEGFMKTGDIGYYDNKGYFYVTDVLKLVILYQGMQVSPETIESVILQHSAVLECGVVGARDEVAGELPTAFVVRKPGATLTERELLDFTEHRLPPSSQLHGGVIFVEEIPKTESGKILRRVLKNQIRDNHSSP